MVYAHGQLGQSSRDVVNRIELRLVGQNIEDKTAPRHRCRPCAEGVASQEPVRRWTRVRPHVRVGVLGSGISDSADTSLASFNQGLEPLTCAIPELSIRECNYHHRPTPPLASHSRTCPIGRAQCSAKWC